MKKYIQFFIAVLISVMCTEQSYCAQGNISSDTVKIPHATVAKASQANYTILKSPTIIVANPSSFMNKFVEFPAKFNKFSTLGLDYEPAMRESQIYIGILIDRDDVGNNVIPLSELKLFMKRSEAEKYTDLSAGDSILIKGKVFSTALGDPWMDITELKVLSKKNKEEKSK